MIQIKRLSSTDSGFTAILEKTIAFDGAQNAAVDSTVADILANVKKRGDEALLEYTRCFDHLDATSIAELELSKKDLQQALQILPAFQREALEQAAERVRAFHKKQLVQSWSYAEPDGTLPYLYLPHQILGAWLQLHKHCQGRPICLPVE